MTSLPDSQPTPIAPQHFLLQSITHCLPPPQQGSTASVWEDRVSMDFFRTTGARQPGTRATPPWEGPPGPAVCAWAHPYHQGVGRVRRCPLAVALKCCLEGSSSRKARREGVTRGPEARAKGRAGWTQGSHTGPAARFPRPETGCDRLKTPRSRAAGTGSARRPARSPPWL